MNVVAAGATSANYKAGSEGRAACCSKESLVLVPVLVLGRACALGDSSGNVKVPWAATDGLSSYYS